MPQYPYESYEPPQYQNPPFGHARDEGTIEEHIHRSVNKRLDRSRSPRDIFDRSSGKGPLIIGIAIVAVLGFAAAAVTLALFLTYRGSAENQISQMHQQLVSAVQQLQEAQGRDASSYNTLSGKLANISNALSYLGQFNQTCTQDFTGPNGPAQYWEMCANHAPG